MWPAVIDLESLLILFICVIGILFIIGYPLLRPFMKVADPNEIDPLQKLNYCLVLGMANITIASALGSFLGPVLLPIIVLLLSLGSIFVTRDILKTKFNLRHLESKKIIKYLPFLVLFSIVLVAAFAMVVGLSGSTNDDAAYHTFFIRIIVDSSQVIDRAIPYYGYLLYSPPGPNIIGALIEITLGYPTEKIVVSLGAIYTILTVLGFYSLLKALFSDERLVIFGCIIATLTWNFWHPLSFTFVVQIAAFAITSMMAIILHMHRGRQGNWKQYLLMLAILLSFSMYIHPVVLLYVILWLLVLNLPRFIVLTKQLLLRRTGSLGNFKKLFLRFFLLAGFTIVLALPYLRTIYTFLTNSMSGLPSDWVLPSERGIKSSVFSLNASAWAFMDFEYMLTLAAGQGAFLFLGLVSFIFVVATPLLLFYNRKIKRNVFGSSRVLQRWVSLAKCSLILFIFLYLILIFVMYLSSITFPGLFGLPSFQLGYLLDPVRSWELWYIPLVLLTCSTLEFVILVLYSIRNTLHIRSSKPRAFFHRTNAKARVLAKQSIPLIIVLGLVFSQVVISYQSGIANYFTWPPNSYLTANTNLHQYSLLTADDLAVFEWIGCNTNNTDVFLVSQADTGQYLTSLTGRKSVYPFGPLEGSEDYRILSFALESDPSNPYLLSLIRQYNVSYIFVGSKNYSSGAPTWESSYWLNGIFDPQKLVQSPFFELAERIGNSWLFKVRTQETYFNETGITLTVLPDTLKIRNSSNMMEWKVLQGTQSKSELNDSVTVTFNPNLLISLSAKNPIDFSNISYMCFWAKGNGSDEYRFSLLDAANNLLFWSFAAYSQYSFFILDISNFSGKSSGALSLKNITEINVSSSTSNNTSISISPILLSKQLLKMNSIEHYDVSNNTSNWILGLSGYSNYTILAPLFLQLDRVEPVSRVVDLYPSSVIFLQANTGQNYTLTFQLNSSDPRTLAIRYLTRPLREILSYNYTTVISRGSGVAASYNSSMVLFSEPSIKTVLNKPWSLDFLEVRSVNINEGEVIMGVYVDGSFIGPEGAHVQLYKTWDDAAGHKNMITELVVNGTSRWLILESPLSDVSTLYISINNLDMVGDFYIYLQVYSFSIYY